MGTFGDKVVGLITKLQTLVSCALVYNKDVNSNLLELNKLTKIALVKYLNDDNINALNFLSKVIEHLQEINNSNFAWFDEEWKQLYCNKFLN